MKFLVVLIACGACTLAASAPKIGVSTFQNSARIALTGRGLVGRIVNGQPAEPNQIPYQCSVLAPVGAGYSVCGGSIISTIWVLTAAHCTVGYSQFNLRFGSLQLLTGGEAQTAFTSINHPEYNPANQNFDISIIPIPTQLTLTPAIQTIRLPNMSQLNSSFIDYQARVSGWGATGAGTGVSYTLNWVHKRIISNVQCAQIYGGAVVAGHVVCGVGHDSQYQTHCGGDSGGPLTINESGTQTLIGVVSFGAASGCHLGYPSGYMRTANFIQWISQNTGIAVRT